MTLPYEDLIERARNGDRLAYEQVVRLFQEKSLAYAYSVLGDYQLAEDATQEAFLSAYLDLMKLREPRAFPGWLRRIVNNEAINVLRRRKLATRTLTPEALEAASREADPARQARQAEIGTEVRRRIAELPAGEREIALAYFVGEESIAAIAGRLGMTPEAAKSRLRRARGRLQRSLIDLVDKSRRQNIRTNSEIRQAASAEAVQQLREERERLARSAEQEQQRILHLLCAEGRLLRFMGQTQDALRLFTQGMKSLRRSDAPSARARLRAEIGISYLKLAKYSQAERALLAAGELLKADPQPSPLRPAILNGLGTCAWGRGNFARARALWDEAVGESRRANSAEWEAAAQNNLSLIDWKLGELAKALAGFKRCRASWQKIGNRHSLAQTLVNVGILEENLGQLGAANTSYRKALALARELGFGRLEGVIDSNLASLALARGSWDAAQRHAEQAARLARAAGDRRSEAIAQENLALAHIGAGETAGAGASLQAGRKIAKAIGDKERQFSLDLVEVEWQLAAGKFAVKSADETGVFRALEKVMQRRGYTGEEARLQRLWAQAELAAGRTTAAQRRVALALASSRRQGNRTEEKRAMVLEKTLGKSTKASNSPGRRNKRT